MLDKSDRDPALTVEEAVSPEICTNQIHFNNANTDQYVLNSIK